MSEGIDEFSACVTVIVNRFFRQQGSRLPGPEDVLRLAVNLRTLIEERGLPRPLGRSELGQPGEMSAQECEPLVARAVIGLAAADWAPLARQMVKACFYPEFKVCRDSFRELASDGTCRRQELSRARSRVSGSHCIDCPHWTSLSPEIHRRYLTEQWRTDPEEFDAHRDVFLPEDFRALRRWLHARARA